MYPLSETESVLRQKAEAVLEKKSFKKGPKLSEIDALKLVHELEVFQIELELQNEELFMAKEKAAEMATEKYAELYDFAPSGYFTLSKEGKIIELNLSCSQMLGKERLRLKNNLFETFVSSDSKPILNLFLAVSRQISKNTRQNELFYFILGQLMGIFSTLILS